MDLGLAQKRALIIGGRANIAAACAKALAAEGAKVACEGALAGKLGEAVVALKPTMLEDPAGLAEAAVAALGGVDIVVAALALPTMDGAFEDAADEQALTAGWDAFTALSAVYQPLALKMRDQGFGRFVWTGPVQVKHAEGGVETVVGLGALGLHKVISGEMAQFGLTANSVLWDAGTGSESEIGEAVGAAATWLASVPAAYVSGYVMTVDGGRSEGIY